ncbi:MAG: CpsB/CapC family capsule biosynthesis tyrosine phosphatase [Tepidisphaeraceae bacterium]
MGVSSFPPMSSGRIDVHSHILPGVDDGCADVPQALACVAALVENGYTHAFCTPHVWPTLLKNNVTTIRAATADLQRHVDAAQLPLSLLPGGEMNLLDAWPGISALPDDQIVTYGLAGKHALFDFWADAYADCRMELEAAIGHLSGRGLKPILAHPERIGAMRDPGAIERLAELGVLFQLNSYCLAEPADERIHQTAVRLLREGRYFLIGTDTHRPAGMASRMRGLQIAADIAGPEAVQRLTVDNPRMLLAGAK